MPKRIKQGEAARHIKELLMQRGFDIPSRKISLKDNQHWTVFNRGERQVGIDSTSGIWIRENHSHDWRCISMPCTVSGALQAIEFLTKI